MPRRWLFSLLLAALSLAPLSPRAALAAPVEVRRDWPCPGCFAAIPAAAEPPAPLPLVVALHGDFNGDQAAPSKLFQALRPACEQARVMLVALRCPIEKGCRTGSFWQWHGTSSHDAGWLGAQIERVSASMPVDPARLYAVGFSGGATYLGWYGPTYAARFAAIAHIAGGMPWGTPCPACKVPVLFTLGRADPMLAPYTLPLRRYYEGCGGHEVVWDALPGVSHDGILGVVRTRSGTGLLDWLLAHRAACGPEADPGDAGASIEPPDHTASMPPTPPTAEPTPTHAPAHPAPPRVSPGCTCALTTNEHAAPFVVPPSAGAIALAFYGRRRRRRAGPHSG